VTETFEAIGISMDAGLEIIVSHRSGETEGVFISHLATAVESAFIKAGAPARGERTAKYNELLRIEDELGTDALFAGLVLFRAVVIEREASLLHLFWRRFEGDLFAGE
jgi:enolase